MFARIFAALLFLNFAPPASAEPYSQRTLETWIDGVLAEFKKAGASETTHGPVTYDAATGAFSVADIKIKLSPVKISADAKSGKDESKAKAINKTDDEDEDADSDNNKDGDEESGKSISKKGSAKDDAKTENDGNSKGEALLLTIPRITAANLKAEGESWKADKLRIEQFRVKIDGKPGALIFDALEFNTIAAPQLAAAMLGKSPGEQIVGFLQQASFKSAVLPGATLTANEKDAKAPHFRLGETRISDFDKGKAGKMTVAASTGSGDYEPAKADGEKGTAEKDHFDVQVGTSEVSDLDIGLYADLFLEKPNRAGQKAQPLYSSLTFSGATVTAGKDVDVKLNSMSATHASMDVPQKGMMAFYTLFLDEKRVRAAREKMDEELFTSYRDWMAMTTFGSFDSKGFVIRAAGTQFGLDTITGKDVGPVIGQLTLGNFSLTNPELKMAFDSINLEKIDTTTFYKALFDEMARNKEKPDFRSLEGKLPTFGNVEVNNLTLQSKDEPPLLVKRVAFDLKSWVKFVPEAFHARIEKMIFPAEAFADLESPNLKDLGYTSIEFNADTAFVLDVKEKTAALSPFKFDFGQAGHVGSELRLSNISEDMLGVAALDDPFTQLGAAKFDKLKIQLVNGDFLEKYVAWKVRTEKKSEAVIKDQIATGMKAFALTIPDETQQKKAQDAIDAFMTQPQSLTLIVTPKAKLSLLDLQLGMMTGGLGLLDKIDFELVANGAS